MQISKEEIRHIANLSMLNLTEEEVEKYTQDMQDILNFAETINNADTEGTDETMGALEIYNVLRKDEVRESMDRDLLLQNAPEQERGMFKIPKVIQ